MKWYHITITFVIKWCGRTHVCYYGDLTGKRKLATGFGKTKSWGPFCFRWFLLENHQWPHRFSDVHAHPHVDTGDRDAIHMLIIHYFILHRVYQFYYLTFGVFWVYSTFVFHFIGELFRSSALCPCAVFAILPQRSLCTSARTVLQDLARLEIIGTYIAGGSFQKILHESI